MLMDIEAIKKDIINQYPAFGSIVDILEYISTKNCVDYMGVPTAGADGNTVYYNPDFLDGNSEIGKLTYEQQKFVFAHEICHVAFNHIERGKGKDQEVWNIATDAVINAFLKKDKMEMVKGVVDIPWAIHYNAEEMYEKLLKKKKKNEKKNKNKQNENGNQPDDRVVNTGHSTHSFWNTSTPKPNDKEIKQIQKELGKLGEKEIFKKSNPVVDDVIKKIKKKIDDLRKKERKKKEEEENGNGLYGGISAGQGTNQVEVKFEDVGMAYPLINWPLILKKPKEDIEIDWSYQNAYLEDGVVTPNLEETPFRLSYETEIVLDTSGSISDNLLRNFLRECKNILNFSKIKVGCFDVDFYGFTEIKSLKDIDEYTFVGRGGTDFSCAIHAFSKDADNKIIFTDGCGSMPNSSVEAIWVVFGGTEIKPKTGKVIYIDQEKLIGLNIKQ